MVGVAENTKVDQIDETPRPFVYLPFAQGIDTVFGIESAHLMARTDGDPADLHALIASELRGVDPAAPVYDVRTFEEAISGLVMPQRMGVALLGVFSALSLLLATIGMYAVASYVAALRTREIGIRLALGAGGREIRRLMLWNASRPVCIGLVLGLALALWLGRLASAFLHGVQPHDPLTLAAATVLMSLAALGATCIPARRASRIEPVSALRQE